MHRTPTTANEVGESARRHCRLNHERAAPSTHVTASGATADEASSLGPSVRMWAWKSKRAAPMRGSSRS